MFRRNDKQEYIVCYTIKNFLVCMKETKWLCLFCFRQSTIFDNNRTLSMILLETNFQRIRIIALVNNLFIDQCYLAYDFVFI